MPWKHAAMASALVVLLPGCRAADPRPIASGSASPLQIATPAGSGAGGSTMMFVPDTAGANDYGLNALALAGLRTEAAKLGMVAPAIAASASSDAAAQAKLVVGRGSTLADGFAAAATAQPNVSFVLIDAPPGQGPGNLRRVSFDLSDGVRQAGMLAAGVSQSRIVAFVGGKDSAEARQLAGAFTAGAGGSVKVVIEYSGSDDTEADAKRLSEGLISDRGADVLLAAADPGGLGTIAAASQKRALAIGIDRDQYDVAPNAVLSSVVKRTDVAAARALDDFLQGRLAGGNQQLGLADGGVELAPFHDLASRVPSSLASSLHLAGS